MAMYTGLKVEIEFIAGTWTDVTTDVDLSQNIVIKYGRTSEFAAPQVATCTLVLNNQTGKYTPQRQTALAADGVTVIAHPYYPNVRPLRRIRVSHTDASVQYFDYLGYIVSFPPALENGVRGYVTITANDRFATLAKGVMNPGILSEQLLDSPVHLWPMGEPVGATAAVDAVNGGPALPLVAAGSGPSVVFGQSGPGVSDGTVVQFAPSGVSFGQIIAGSVPGLSLAAFTMECWVNAGTSMPAWGSGGLMGLDDPTSQPRFGLAIDASGHPNYNDNSGSSTVSSSTSILDNGWHHVAATRATSGGAVTLYVDGVSVGSSVGSAAFTAPTVAIVGDWTIPMAARFRGSIGHVAVYNKALSAARIAAHAAATNGYSGDTTSARIARFLAYRGLTSADWNLDAGQAVVSSYPQSGKTVPAGCQDMALTEAGGAAVYVAQDGRVRFVNRKFRFLQTTPQLTFDAELDLDSSIYAPAYDSLTLFNDSTGTRATGSGAQSVQNANSAASAAEFGKVEDQAFTSYATTDADVLAVTQWRVANNAQPAFRLGQVQVDFVTATTAGIYAAQGGVQIGSRMRVGNLPFTSAPKSQVDVIIEGWTLTINFQSFKALYDTTPADSPSMGAYDTARYSPDAGAMTTQLTTAAVTTLVVTTASGATFTTTAGSYPLDIKVNEEVITLNSAPGGATSPQTFTGVTRGAKNTVAAIQPASSVITLYPQATYTL